MSGQRKRGSSFAEPGVLKEAERAKLAEVFAAYPFIIAAYQFGSTVRGGAGDLSDLDIALVVDQAAPEGIAMLRTEGLLAHKIRQALGQAAPEVDVVTLNERSLVFQHTVLRTGRLVYEADPVARRRHVWGIIQAYLDFEPTLRWMRRFQKAGWLRRCGLT